MSDFLKKIDKNSADYRAIPFWSWNGKLEDGEIERQIHIMKDARDGGFFMHSRGGLKTEYMSDDFLERTAHSADVANKLGMEAWAYDEFGWPSGFAAGVVPALGYEYRQKSVHIKSLDKGETLPERTLAVYHITGTTAARTNSPAEGDLVAYEEVNNYYIDALNKNSIAAFIKVTHEKFKKFYGDELNKKIAGFFTDEPQYANGNIPWSECLEEEYRKVYGEDMRDKLYLLENELDGYEQFRYRYYLTANRLFTEGFMKQIYDWCEENGCRLTGHMMSENDLIAQMRCTGGVMPSYEYFHIPGIDWLCRFIDHPLVPLQLSSACEQLGKKRRITETFALCGWDVSYEELKWIASWQYVNGVNMMCQHLEPYSMEGFRKRDFPPAMFYQSAWFKKYDIFNHYFDRLAALLAEGKSRTDLLVIHPLRTAYITYKTSSYDAIAPYSNGFSQLSLALNNMKIEHHYGDETLISRHGSVSGADFNVGECSYSKVLLPDMLTIGEKTLELLIKFGENGGKIYSCGEMPTLVDGVADSRLDKLKKYTVALENPVKKSDCVRSSSFGVTFDNVSANETDETAEQKFIRILGRDDGIVWNKTNGGADEVCARGRDLPDGEQVWFITNLSREHDAQFTLTHAGNVTFTQIDLEKLNENDISTAFDEKNSSINLHLDAMQNAVIAVRNRPAQIIPVQPDVRLTFDDVYNIDSCDENCITIDSCRYRISRGKWQKFNDVVLLNDQLLALRKKFKLELEFEFDVEDIDKIGKLSLVCESPEKYDIYLNGEKYDFRDEGFYVDTAFRRSDIRRFIKTGKNTVTFKLDYFQRKKVYDVLFGENVHETERNKLTYDTELEAIYIIGEFSVKNNTERSYGEKKSIYTGRNFTLCQPVSTVCGHAITESGFWFFRGEMTLNQSVSVDKQPDTRYFIEPEFLNAPAAELYVNSKPAAFMAFSPYKYDVTDLLTNGDNTVSIKLYASNRNMLGPFHRNEGESYAVSPWTFLDRNGRYDDGFTFVKFGFKL